MIVSLREPLAARFTACARESRSRPQRRACSQARWLSDDTRPWLLLWNFAPGSGVKLLRWLSDDIRSWFLLWNFAPGSGVKLLRWLSDDTRSWLLLWNFAPGSGVKRLRWLLAFENLSRLASPLAPENLARDPNGELARRLGDCLTTHDHGFCCETLHRVLVWNFCGDCRTTHDHGFCCETLHQFIYPSVFSSLTVYRPRRN